MKRVLTCLGRVDDLDLVLDRVGDGLLSRHAKDPQIFPVAMALLDDLIGLALEAVFLGVRLAGCWIVEMLHHLEYK